MSLKLQQFPFSHTSLIIIPQSAACLLHFNRRHVFIVKFLIKSKNQEIYFIFALCWLYHCPILRVLGDCGKGYFIFISTRFQFHCFRSLEEHHVVLFLLLFAWVHLRSLSRLVQCSNTFVAYQNRSASFSSGIHVFNMRLVAIVTAQQRCCSYQSKQISHLKFRVSLQLLVKLAGSNFGYCINVFRVNGTN